jgi:hypothetical protein
MTRSEFVFVHCKIARGAFTEERVFYVPLFDGGEYIGACSRDYCYTRRGKPFSADEPASEEQEVQGKLLARVVRVEGDKVLVSVPDGEVVTVSADTISEAKRVFSDVPPGVGRSLWKSLISGHSGSCCERTMSLPS